MQTVRGKATYVVAELIKVAAHCWLFLRCEKETITMISMLGTKDLQTKEV